MARVSIDKRRAGKADGLKRFMRPGTSQLWMFNLFLSLFCLNMHVPFLVIRRIGDWVRPALRCLRAIRSVSQNSIGRTDRQIVERQLTIAPTITVRPGFAFRIIVTRGLELEPAAGEEPR